MDPRGLTGATAFFELGGQGYGGVVFNTEWQTDNLVSALEDSGARLDENTYAGKTIYEAESGMGSALGVLGGGQFVLGSLEAVEDTLDVSAGNSDPLSGDLVNRFNGATSGYVNFASEVPGMLLPTATGGGTNVEGLDELEAVSGGFYKNGGNFGVEVNMHTDDSSSASDLADSLSDLRDDRSSTVENPDVEDLLEKIRFSASGSTATVSLEESVSTVKDYVDEYAAAIASTAFGGLFGLGLALGTTTSNQQVETRPQVAFGFDYERGESYGGSGPNSLQGSDGTITITHQSGDSVRASELHIRGDGVATGVWRDASAARNLAGDASGDVGGDPAVVAGDGVTVEVRSDYTVRVVYAPEDGGESAVLATDSGPNA